MTANSTIPAPAFHPALPARRHSSLACCYVRDRRWAATTELSSAVIAQGVVVVDSSVKKVQHPSGGVRRRDCAFAMAIVSAPATSCFVSTRRRPERPRQLSPRMSTNFWRARPASKPSATTHARSSFQRPARPRRDPNSDAARAIAAERSLFNLRRQARDGQKVSVEGAQRQLQEEIKGYSGQLEAKKKEVEFISERNSKECGRFGRSTLSRSAV